MRKVCRGVKKAVQQGRSEGRGESYSGPYGEPLSDARTPLADFFNTLLRIANRVEAVTRSEPEGRWSHCKAIR
jgi:hypothetical protein